MSDRDVMVDAGTGIDVAGLLETGISVSPDMAGGALVDPTAASSGILTHPAQSGPDGLAIPVAVVRDVEDQLDSAGSSGKVVHGWLGVLCSPDDADRTGGGAQIDFVMPGQPGREGRAPGGRCRGAGRRARWSAAAPSSSPRCAPSGPRTRSTCSTCGTGGPVASRSTSARAIRPCSPYRTGDGLRSPIARSPAVPRDHEGMTTTASDDQLEALDRELLNAVQWDFPLEPRPYAALGERLGAHRGRRSGSASPG